MKRVVREKQTLKRDPSAPRQVTKEPSDLLTRALSHNKDQSPASQGRSKDPVETQSPAECGGKCSSFA